MKKFVACLLAVSMSFATIGCGGEKKDAGKDAAKPADAKPADAKPADAKPADGE